MEIREFIIGLDYTAYKSDDGRWWTTKEERDAVDVEVYMQRKIARLAREILALDESDKERNQGFAHIRRMLTHLRMNVPLWDGDSITGEDVNLALRFLHDIEQGGHNEN